MAPGSGRRPTGRSLLATLASPRKWIFPMASVITSRRATPKYIPTPAEIEAAKAELDAKRLASLHETLDEGDRRERDRLRVAAYRRRKANLTLQQNDQCEPIDLDEHRDPRQTEQWLPVPTAEPEPQTLNDANTSRRTVCGKVPVPEGGPVEMIAADRCGFDLGSFFELNAGLDQVAREERWTLGDVDPETVDLEADSLADYRFAIAKPLPPLKTERKPKPFKAKHEARPFRSSKGGSK